MADLKISQLTSATTPLAGTEVVPLVQSGSTKKASVDNLTANKVTKVASTDKAIVRFNGTAGEVQNSSPVIDDNGNLGVGVAAGSVDAKVRIEQSSAVTVFQARRPFYANCVIGLNGTSVNYVDADSQYFRKIDGTGVMSLTGGNVTFDTGNLIQGTAAKGVNFTANTPAAGMTSQLLNWYEEGTWTPGIAFGGASTGITYSKQLGRYTRVGRQVTVYFDVRITGKGSVTGDATITGLPFVVNADCVTTGIVDPITAMVGLVAGGAIISSAGSGASFIYLFQQTTTARNLMNDTNFNTTASLGGSLTYFV